MLSLFKLFQTFCPIFNRSILSQNNHWSACRCHFYLAAATPNSLASSAVMSPYLQMLRWSFFAASIDSSYCFSSLASFLPPFLSTINSPSLIRPSMMSSLVSWVTIVTKESPPDLLQKILLHLLLDFYYFCLNYAFMICKKS